MKVLNLILVSVFILSLGLSISLILALKSASIFYDMPSDHQRKIHRQPTIRVGGLSLVVATAIGLILQLLVDEFAHMSDILKLAVLSLAIFLIGFFEDITSRFGAITRLLCLTITCVATTLWMDFSIDSLESNEFFSFLIGSPEVAWLFIAFAVVGMTNSYNIIDGANGLCASLGTVALLPMTLVLYDLGLHEFYEFGLIVISAICGFFLVNFFTGKIFLGDGGAYLIGFLSASFSLIVAGPQINKVSPWLPIAVNAYPIIETLFSITRRCVNGVSPFHPDSNHLHTLCFRFFKKKLSRKFFSPSLLNSLSVLPITFSSAVLSFLAILYRKDSLVLVVLLISYGFLYLCFYSFLSKMARREKLI